jgi:transketolase
LVRAALNDPRVILLTGDHGYALFDDFRQRCPDQYINAGVAEQNMVGVAAGLAKAGFRPIVYGLSAFVPVRVLEQIKLDVCYEALPVVFIGDGAGVVYSALGSSHQSTEDIAALRALPHLSILSPCDAFEMQRCFELALSAEAPVYLRMGKADLGNVHTAPLEFQQGDLLEIKVGTGSVAFLATGSMVVKALELSQRWTDAAVWSVPSIKPLNAETVAHICQRHRVVAVLEEHSVYGGLGGAVAEISSSRAPTWVFRAGVQDRFSEFCGSYDYLMREHGLSAEQIQAALEAFVAPLGLVSCSA